MRAQAGHAYSLILAYKQVMVASMLGVFRSRTLTQLINLSVTPCIILILVTLTSQAARYDWAAIGAAVFILELILAKHKQHMRAMSFQLKTNEFIWFSELVKFPIHNGVGEI